MIKQASISLISLLLISCSESDGEMPTYTYKDCQGFVEPLRQFTETLQTNIKTLEYGQCLDQQLVKQIEVYYKQFKECVFVEGLYTHERGLPRVGYEDSILQQAKSDLRAFHFSLETCLSRSTPKTRDLLIRTSRKDINELHEKIILYQYQDD